MQSYWMSLSGFAFPGTDFGEDSQFQRVYTAHPDTIWHGSSQDYFLPGLLSTVTSPSMLVRVTWCCLASVPGHTRRLRACFCRHLWPYEGRGGRLTFSDCLHRRDTAPGLRAASVCMMEVSCVCDPGPPSRTPAVTPLPPCLVLLAVAQAWGHSSNTAPDWRWWVEIPVRVLSVCPVNNRDITMTGWQHRVLTNYSFK